MQFSVFVFSKIRFQLLFISIFIVTGPVLYAEVVDSTKVYSLHEVSITEQNSKVIVRSSTPFQLLSSNQIERLNVLQVSDAVKFFSGVTVKDYGGIGGLKTISVRSLGANHTAINYDGITLSDCQTGQIDIGRFSLDNVKMLSLNNGQSDNIFQPARLFSSSSILNIQTLKPKFNENTYINGRFSVKSGSFGLINPSFILENRINAKISSSLSAEWLSANGEYPYVLNYSYLGNGISSTEKRKNTDVNNFRVEGALYFDISNNESGYIKSYFYSSNRGLPGATILYNTANFSSQRLWDKSFFTQVHYQKKIVEKLSIQLNSKYNYGYLHYLDSTFLNGAGKLESTYKQNEHYTSFSALYRAFQHISFSFSTDAFINRLFAKFESSNLNDDFAKPIRYNLLSVVAVKYATENLLISTSLLSTFVNDNLPIGSEGTSRHKISPSFNLSVKPFNNTDLRLRAFYKNSFRLPTFNDLYYSRIGNLDLKPEIANQLNIGISYAISPLKWLPQLSATMDMYRNNVKDKIIAMPTKNIFVWSMVNLGNVEISGVDFATEAKINSSKNSSIFIGGTYTYQRALDVSTVGSNTFGHQIPYTPRVSGSGKVGLETPLVNIYYTLLWSGHRYAGFQNYAENHLTAYSDQSISFSRNFLLKNNILSTNIEILNLLNENYAIIKWFPMPGRSVRATVSYKF